RRAPRSASRPASICPQAPPGRSPRARAPEARANGGRNTGGRGGAPPGFDRSLRTRAGPGSARRGPTARRRAPDRAHDQLAAHPRPPIEGRLMADASAVQSSRPTVLVDGTEAPSLTDGQLRLRVREDVHGLYDCEVEVGNWGPSSGQPGFLFFDRNLV